MLTPSVVAPTNPTSPETIAAAVERIGPLHGLPFEDRLWLAEHGEERTAKAGSVLFEEGAPVEHMMLILKGEVHVRRNRGGPMTLFIGRTGQMTGLLPFSRMKTYGGHGYTASPTWVLEYEKSTFPEMVAAVPSITQRCVNVLLDRVREVTRMEQQTEKLAALGKLSANLAHELNNPASAAQRAASGLLDELHVYGHEKYRLGSLCLSDEHVAVVRKWQESVREHAKEYRGNPAEFAAREDQLSTWMR